MPDPIEIAECNAQFLAAWIHFNRGLPSHQIEHTDGVSVIHSGTGMVLINAATLSSPASDLADLERRVRRAAELAKTGGVPWLFALPDSWAPGGDAGATVGLLADLGFQPSVSLMGMVAEAITPPRREIAGLTLRRVADAETRAAIADLNSIAYNVPLPAGRASVAHEGLWDDSAFGRVGYVGEEPVCCAATFLVEGIRYVGFVVTAPEHRRKGYAEAVMRCCLDDALSATGVQRTVLHATDMGRPVYEGMGYHAVMRVGFYTPPPQYLPPQA
ncbi:GNAT family N-acetyltransferase [Sorangium sp. So ce1000]|uniref:GNAT family N-acetyltransferase n=1 Tax=Sorangium sp. So ce1000 TaxID=3133325 RepID=UPI003F62FDC7